MRLKRPREPAPGECCGSGCARCVWDIYYDQLSAYESERTRLKEAGELSEYEDEPSESDLSSETSEELSDYIGTVVVKMLGPSSEQADARHTIPTTLKDGAFHIIRSVRLHACSTSKPTVDAEEPICVLDLEAPQFTETPCPGDVVEILAPNNAVEGEDFVQSVCERLRVDPESVCELHRSPYVPEDHFPPWLPLRQPMTVRSILTYYVDLSSCSYLLRPVFFQSLLRIFDNKNRGKTSKDPAEHAADGENTEAVELLRACAEEPMARDVFRRVLNKGKPLCYPCLADALDVFSFIHLPLDRLLEISGPLQPRKFSIAGYTPGVLGDSGCVQLCVRKVTKKRSANQLPIINTEADKTAQTLASLLNCAAEARRLKCKSSPLFHGHATTSLVEQAETGCHTALANFAATAPCSHLYLSADRPGTSTFASELRSALVSLSHAPRGCSPLILVGAGTGIAPLVAAVRELIQRRQSSPSPAPPFPCWTVYGARNLQEMVYHDFLTEAHRTGAISRYAPVLSREVVSPTPHKHVTDWMLENGGEIRDGLITGTGRVFVCGPTAVLRSVRQLIGSTLLGEPDDDDSVREQRVILLEEKRQLCFDTWSTGSIFE